MSSASHYKFLNKLHKELLVSSSTYRVMTADSKYHTFTVSSAGILKETNKEFKLRNIEPNAEQAKDIADAAKKAYTAIRDVIKKLKKEVDVDKSTYIQNERLKFVFKTYDLVGPKPSKLYPAQRDPYVTFSKIKEIYRDSLAEYFKDLQLITNDAIRKKSKSKSGNYNKETTVGKFFHLGHLDKMGVSETQLQDGLSKALMELPEEERENVNSVLKQYGIKLSYIRNDDKDMMFVKIESATDNLKRGGSVGQAKKALLKSLNDVLLDLNVWMLDGSDSPIERKRKQASIALIDPFRTLKSKNIKTKGKKVKAKKSAKKATTFTTTPKETIGKEKLKMGTMAVATSRRKEKSDSPASSPLHMIAMFNKQLPQVVAKNMVSPALQNQTGRFASSVRVTDITKTPKGFPSIGYTYDKFPYQTFETGYAQGNPLRDPRNLIQGSIREIAAQLAMSRFFMRRV